MREAHVGVLLDVLFDPLPVVRISRLMFARNSLIAFWATLGPSFSMESWVFAATTSAVCRVTSASSMA